MSTHTTIADYYQAEGGARLLIRQLNQKFDGVPEDTMARVQAASPDELIEWGSRILTADTLDEVFQ